MSVMSRRPLADPQTAELTLGLFAARTSVEMERRRSERALQASEARNRAILRAIPDVMFVLDHAGRVLDYAANEANELYAPPEQVIGRNIRDSLPVDAAESVARAWRRQTTSARPSSVTFSIETAKGTFFYDALVVPFDTDSEPDDRARRHRATSRRREEYARSFLRRLLHAAGPGTPPDRA